MNTNLQSNKPPHVSLAAKTAIVLFSLAAGLSYRASISEIPLGIYEDVFLLALSILFLVIGLLLRRNPKLKTYWEVPFAFFIFTTAGFLGDVMVSPLQQAIMHNVLHETSTANDPLGSTVLGTVLVQIVSTLSLVTPIIVFTKASGNDLGSIFINRQRNRWPLIVGVLGFAVFFFLAAFGFSQRFFPNNGVTTARFFSLAPAMIILVLCNGFREELWFRGLFLKKYGAFVRPFFSNLLAAIIFTSFHVQVSYSRSLIFFLGVTLVEGLVLGYLVQKSQSILASIILHAGSDIPIFLVYLSYVSS